VLREGVIHPDGRWADGRSRWRRKHESLLSRAPSGEQRSAPPGRASWWIAVLFAAGSLCFLVAPLPRFIDLVGPEADAAVFFVGSIFFTSAASLQLWHGRAGDRLDRWSSAVQLLGTLFFNVTTFRALSVTLDSPSYDRLVWRPDALGSVCFLVSGVLAYVAVAGALRWRLDGVMALVNLLGCVAFGIAAAGAYVLPSSTSEVSVTAVNVMTSLGALCFLVGAVLLMRGETPRRSPGPCSPPSSRTGAPPR
jgi:hypothetical protein